MQLHTQWTTNWLFAARNLLLLLLLLPELKRSKSKLLFTALFCCLPRDAHANELLKNTHKCTPASRQCVCVCVCIYVCVSVAVLINYKGSKTIEQIASSGNEDEKGQERQSCRCMKVQNVVATASGKTRWRISTYFSSTRETSTCVCVCPSLHNFSCLLH